MLVHHTKPGRRAGHRGHRRAVPGRSLAGCPYWCGSTSSDSAVLDRATTGRHVLLLAVGADYNLLLISRFKEEIARRTQNRHHPRDGRLPAASSPRPAWCSPPPCPPSSSATCVVLGQFGTTIGLGLLFDTLDRAVVHDAVDRRPLGRWFWWPLNNFRTAGNAAPEPEPEPEATTAPLSQSATVRVPSDHGAHDLARLQQVSAYMPRKVRP